MTDEPGIALIDTVDRRVLREAAIEYDPISAAFSPNGDRVAIATNTGEVGVLDVTTGEWVRPPAVGHRDTVITVAYAPDGNTLVSGGLNGRVTLWDGQTGAALGTVVVSQNVATGARFAPTGTPSSSPPPTAPCAGTPASSSGSQRPARSLGAASPPANSLFCR